MKEEWRTVVVDGKEHPWYSISNFGNIRSHLRQQSLGTGKGSRTIYDPNFYKDLSPIAKRRNDSLYESLVPGSIPAAVLVLAKYQYQGAFVADQEINILACMTELMVECEFK